jgi:hypothetical protein
MSRTSRTGAGILEFLTRGVWQATGASLAPMGEHFENAPITVNWFHVICSAKASLEEERSGEAE